MERSYANNPRKSIFMLMTSPVTSHHDDKISLLYSRLNQISTFSRINHERFAISSLFFQPQMYLGSVQRFVVFQGQRSKSWSRVKKIGHFEIAITSLIFEIQRRSKAQSVGISMTYLVVWPKVRYHFRCKNSPWPQNGGHFEMFKIFQIGSFWHQIWKDCRKLFPKRIFDLDYVTDDVTAWRQTWPFIFMFKWNCQIFLRYRSQFLANRH